MRRGDLKVQTYMSEIAGDTFFWVYFLIFSWRSTTIPIIREGYHTAVLIPSPLRVSKMSNNKISGI